MEIKLTIMGCGDSHGVPRAGDEWGECNPHNEKNRRTRCSLLIQSPSTTLIIDTGSDFRHQTIRHKVKYINAVLYTHAHGDHVGGMDDLRTYFMRQKNPIDIYANKKCLETLRQKYPYLFEQVSEFYPVVVASNEIKEFYNYKIGDISFSTHNLIHGEEKTTGFRFGDIAYSVDMHDLENTDETHEAFKGVKTWIVDAGGYNYHRNPVHASFDRVFELNDRIVNAERVILNVLPIYIDFDKVSAELPDGYELAYDGLEFRAQ